MASVPVNQALTACYHVGNVFDRANGLMRCPAKEVGEAQVGGAPDQKKKKSFELETTFNWWFPSTNGRNSVMDNFQKLKRAVRPL